MLIGLISKCAIFTQFTIKLTQSLDRHVLFYGKEFDQGIFLRIYSHAWYHKKTIWGYSYRCFRTYNTICVLYYREDMSRIVCKLYQLFHRSDPILNPIWSSRIPLLNKLHHSMLFQTNNTLTSEDRGLVSSQVIVQKPAKCQF